MKKILFILLIFFLTIGAVSAGNNTTEIEHPTSYQSDLETVTALESGDSNISFSNGYKGYCIEWGEHSAEENETFYVDDTSKIINKQTHEDVSNYLKVMFLFFYNKTQENPIATQHMIWKFTDNKQFSKFDRNWYNDIVIVGNVIQVPDYGTVPLNSTHQMVFEFKTFVAKINEYQNYFGYKFYIEKISSNESIQINNSTVNNNTTLLLNISLNETDIQFNTTSDIKKEKKIVLSTSSILKKHITGAPLKWFFGWIVILLIIILLCYRKED